jgi:hypothetical protein
MSDETGLRPSVCDGWKFTVILWSRFAGYFGDFEFVGLWGEVGLEGMGCGCGVFGVCGCVIN